MIGLPKGDDLAPARVQEGHVNGGLYLRLRHVEGGRVTESAHLFLGLLDHARITVPYRSRQDTAEQV